MVLLGREVRDIFFSPTEARASGFLHFWLPKNPALTRRGFFVPNANGRPAGNGDFKGMKMSESTNPAYRPLVEACGEHGISRTVAFDLARKGLLDTFTIGKRRYVRLESLRTLPDRLAVASGGGR